MDEPDLDFSGQWDVIIDEKWRLKLPAELELSFVYFVEGDGGLRMYGEPPIEEAFLLFCCEVKAGRVLVPELLRGSPSFYCGKTVRLAGMGNYLEIWPWPASARGILAVAS